MYKKLLIILLTSLFLASCASLNSQPKLQNTIINEQSVTALVSSQGADVSYIHKGDDREIFCSSAGNDFAFTQSGSNSLSASQGGTSLGVSSGSSAGVAELGGINAGVLLSREVMYRTCEFMANLKAIGGLTPEIAQQLYQDAVKAALQFSSDYKDNVGTGQATQTVPSPVTPTN